MSSSRLRDEERPPRPYYGKVAWTGVHRRPSADAAAADVSPMNSRYSRPGEDKRKQGNTKLSYEKVAWTWSDRRRNFSTGLGAESPVASSPLLRGKGTKSARSYSKSSWEKKSTRPSKPLAQVCLCVCFCEGVFVEVFCTSICHCCLCVSVIWRLLSQSSSTFR